jgi:hypothetical protein
MELVVAKKPGLEEIVQNIHQNVYLLNKGDGASKFAEPGMIDHIFLIQWQTDKNPVLLTIQAKIFFRTEFSITDLRILDGLEKLCTEKIIGKQISLDRAISLVGQKAIDDSIIKQFVNKLKLFVLDVYGGSLATTQFDYSVFIN